MDELRGLVLTETTSLGPRPPCDTGEPAMHVPIETLVTAGRLDLLLERHRAAPRIGERRYALDAIERALLLSDPGAIREDLRAEILGLGVDASLFSALDAPVPPHAVVLPFVAPGSLGSTGGLGFGRLVFVSLRGKGRGAVVTAALEAAAAEVKEAPPPGGLERYGLAYAQPAVGERLDITGRSLGAATFTSAVALFSGRPVRPGTLISGDLNGGRVESVGGLAQKLSGCLASRDDLRRAIVPTRNRASVRGVADGLEVIGVATTRALLDAALEATPATHRDPDQAVTAARSAFWSGWDGYRWPTQRESLERLLVELPEYRPDLRVEVLTMRGAVTRHLGAPEESRKILAEARDLAFGPLGDEAVPDAQRTVLAQHEALTFARLCRWDDATQAADEAIAIARRGRLRGELLKAHGSAGLVALARGRAKRAVKHQRRALELVRAHRPRAAPRTSGYLIEALGRSGDLAEARECYRQALGEVEAAPGSRQASREAWLRVAWASALAHAERYREVRSVLEVPVIEEAIGATPLPGLTARRLLGEALTHSRRPDRGYALLADSPVSLGRGALPHVRFLAQLNVLVEARARTRHGALDRDAAARSLAALTHLPRYGDVPRFLGKHSQRAARALESNSPGQIHRTLGPLLGRAIRL